jgi:dihydrofolate reductase
LSRRVHSNEETTPRDARASYGRGKDDAVEQGGTKVKISVFVGVSVDGFIARANGELDFLDAGGDEPHGYEEFIATVDTIVMGRKTFETVLGFAGWHYGEKPVVVLSRQPLDLSLATSRGGRVERMTGPPADIATALSGRGVQHVYLDGGVTVQGFLRAGLVTRLIITRVPVLIGGGIPLFGALLRDIPLRHVATKAFRGGLVQTEYEVGAA